MNRLFSLSLSRSLIRCVGGKTDTAQFLQGMITNDMNHLANGSPCIYALFLNKAGRVLYDTIIYKASQPDETKDGFLIECDTSIASTLIKHLKLYRVRRKIDINVTDELDVWCLKGPLNDVTQSKNLKAYVDPRLKDIGLRIISTKNCNVKDLVGSVEEGNSDDYISHRYKLGICEGIVDLPPEKAFPLESNCDYMHGVSFHKGCYIGQELTARTYHTGVTRKRLMPLLFDNPINFKADDSVDIKNQDGQVVGKARNVIETHGLGLLRMEQALASGQLHLNENRCRTERPTWWPIEAEKTSRLTKN